MGDKTNWKVLSNQAKCFDVLFSLCRYDIVILKFYN